MGPCLLLVSRALAQHAFELSFLCFFLQIRHHALVWPPRSHNLLTETCSHHPLTDPSLQKPHSLKSKMSQWHNQAVINRINPLTSATHSSATAAMNAATGRNTGNLGQGQNSSAVAMLNLAEPNARAHITTPGQTASEQMSIGGPSR